MSQPAILSDPADATHPYKMWYVGNNPDANGNFHDRIGLAYQKQPTSVSQWEKVAGPSGDPYWESVVTLGTQGTAFDSMKVSDLRPVDKPVAAGAGLYGFHTGTNAADFADRIGVKESADGGLTWSEVPDAGTLIGAGPAGTFDAGGVACPAPLAIGGDTRLVRVPHLVRCRGGFEDRPAHGLGRSADRHTHRRAGRADGGTFDAAGQADPWAVRDGAAIALFYAGKSASGGWSIGRSVSATGVPTAHAAGVLILAPTPGTYDAGGLRKPVAHQAPDGSWRLFYTAIGPDGVKRIAWPPRPPPPAPGRSRASC